MTPRSPPTTRRAGSTPRPRLCRRLALRGWTQEQAPEELAPYLGAKLSGASFSALERSAWNVNRIKQFSADDLLALSRGFDLPIGFFFVPPPPAFDAGLYGPDAGSKGLDPIASKAPPASTRPSASSRSPPTTPTSS